MIRPATTDDADGILGDVWQESLLGHVFVDHLSSSSHVTLVAIDAEITGFVSAFTISGANPRFELDLVAVRPAEQGMGIGTHLVKEALLYGEQLGASLAGASIRTDNLASQRAFSRAGFETDSLRRTLLLWEPVFANGATDQPQEAEIIPVDTFTYRGLWLEGLETLGISGQRAVVQCAQDRTAKEGRLNAGAFVADSCGDGLASDLRTNATVHGTYHRWERPLSGY